MACACLNAALNAAVESLWECGSAPKSSTFTEAEAEAEAEAENALLVAY